MNLAHVGGHVGNGGIQAHSCGPLFPFYVLGIGQWVAAFDPEHGRVGCLYNVELPDAYDKAESDCRNALCGLPVLIQSLAEAEAVARSDWEWERTWAKACENALASIGL